MENEIYPPPKSFVKKARIGEEDYLRLYEESIQRPEDFWAREAKRIDWMKPYSRIREAIYSKNKVSIEWFADGTLNASVNCLDRHIPARGDKTAILFERDTPGESEKITYRQALEQVCRLANVLKEASVKKGDRVTIYMPMIPEAAYAMLACARIGAVHSVVFGGFSSDALAGRILDCQSDFVITADESVRGGKTVPLKANVDEALQQCPHVKQVFVIKRTGADVPMQKGRDMALDEAMRAAKPSCPPEEMGAEDPLFILYTSGSTGKPKGVLHTTGGYMVYASMTHEYVFDLQEEDVFWCTADVGWVTGHSYIVYGPLANGATTLIFEGIPTYPDAGRFWQICDAHQVSSFYTAPTALRALMREGDGWVQKSSRQSLRLLGTVGEPINPEAWRWYHKVVGEERCPIVDTWWQTETGGILITPLPGATTTKPGSATRPFFGVQPALLDDEGQEIQGAGRGNLCLAASWPGQMRSVYGDHKRFIKTYFVQFPGFYFTGDGCRRDEDGYYWITGRVDDVINVSGHRLGTAEIESALVLHEGVAEAAVVGCPHEVKGQGIYAFVTLKADRAEEKGLDKVLAQWVGKQIGPIARPDFLQFAPSLPKTRSGKIMRRILRKIAANDFQELGDTSTLADPSIVQSLIEGRKNKP